MYALLAIKIEADPSRQLTLKDNIHCISAERFYPVESFFTNVLLINFGSTRNDKAIKKELVQLFIKQIVKGLAYRP